MPSSVWLVWKEKKNQRKVNEETVSGCPRCDEFVIKWQLSQSINTKDNMLVNWVYIISFFRSQTFWMVTNIWKSISNIFNFLIVYASMNTIWPKVCGHLKHWLLCAFDLRQFLSCSKEMLMHLLHIWGPFPVSTNLLHKPDRHISNGFPNLL